MCKIAFWLQPAQVIREKTLSGSFFQTLNSLKGVVEPVLLPQGCFAPLLKRGRPPFGGLAGLTPLTK